ncbi:MAG: hypothetical protein HUU03_11845, partial [Planctomycetaceae bacterium]|nr:hypothetical protein [Planctomycetaceae bacterium]
DFPPTGQFVKVPNDVNWGAESLVWHLFTQVKGERGMERHFELLAANAGKLTLFLTADDVAAGRLSVSINGKAMTFDGLAHDAAFILSEFERTGDRKLPYVARLHIDVAVALKGAK